MITTLELTRLQEEATQCVINCTKDISSLIKQKSATPAEYELKESELKRLKRMRKKAKEDHALYKTINLYLSSGVQMEGIKQQRNELLIKLATIDERYKFERIYKASKNPVEQEKVRKFETKYGVKKLKQQLKILNFILK